MVHKGTTRVDYNLRVTHPQNRPEVRMGNGTGNGGRGRTIPSCANNGILLSATPPHVLCVETYDSRTKTGHCELDSGSFKTVFAGIHCVWDPL